jgi:hypothetical protein
MKLSIVLHGKTYSVESDDQFDGQEVSELVEQFKGLLVNAGYHPESVDQYFNTEYQWFTQEEIDENRQGHWNHSNKWVKDWHDQCESNNE